MHVCLLDTGSAGIRMSAELARAAGIPLPDTPSGPDIVVGGGRSQVFETLQTLALRADGHTHRWDAPVSFCDPWPHPFGLLGHLGFFDTFDVIFEGARSRFSIQRAS